MIEAVVTLGEAVEITLRTDLGYAPDPASDVCTRALETALDAFRAVIATQTEP